MSWPLCHCRFAAFAALRLHYYAEMMMRYAYLQRLDSLALFSPQRYFDIYDMPLRHLGGSRVLRLAPRHTLSPLIITPPRATSFSPPTFLA